ncbi:DUF4276 family protein [Luteirhabdus pelagi]|uniref:DUF4276 family protein n=1 Tax=Luteirhabdus pelagi TaxID=2792783 RepID=UPI00193AA0DA|nr:DUF4276 family protein [Luteirhabdus pelagi]
MRRIVIIVEGDTEEAFVNTMLQPYFIHKGIVVTCFKIKHTKGGLTKYAHFKKDIIKTVYEKNVVISSLIDFYALPKDFPRYDEATAIVNKSDRLLFLENAIREDIEQTKGASFAHLFPYIQLHEFEALVFSSITGIQALFEEDEANMTQIRTVINSHNSPEDINDSPATAPSKRLLNLISGYNKIVDGVLILNEIGLPTIIEKCPRFRWWLNELERRASL